MKLILRLILNSFTLLIVSYIIPGFIFETLWDVLVAVIIMGVINTFIKPVLQIVFIPLTIITLGLTAFLINVVLLWAVSFIVPGFSIESFFTAIMASIAITLVTIFLNRLGERKK